MVSGALLALLLTGPPAQTADTVTLSPQVVAVVRDQGKFQVTVDLEHLNTKKKRGKLSAELLGPDGRSLARAVVTGSKERPAHFRFDLPAPRLAADRLQLVCRWQGRRLAVPVQRVLLARAHETALAGSPELFAGSRAALRCEVHAVKSLTETRPLADARVALSLRPAERKGKAIALGTGQTGSDGSAQVRFRVPELPDGRYLLQVLTRSALGMEKLVHSITLKSDTRILLVTDKPLYQPGQTMHLRALALRPFDLKPVAGAPLVFEVEDAKGNKVFKRAHKTSAYGIAHDDFQLAGEVNEGAYQVRAILGQQQAQKTVTVKPYVLPKFKVKVTSDKRYYLPREAVKAEVQSDYFFGKPVAGGKVKVTASTFDVEFKAFQTWEGKTDASGHAKFEIQLPDSFVGQPLQKGDALVRLEVKVTDTAGHTETVSRSWTVSDQPIRVSLIPEGGRLVPGVDNRVYVAALYPDGTPAPCTIKLWEGKDVEGKPLAEVKTNAAGLAEFSFTPRDGQLRQPDRGARKGARFRKGGPKRPFIRKGPRMLGGVNRLPQGAQWVLDMHSEARDAKGTVAHHDLEVNVERGGKNVLLRLDRAVYQGGDRLRAEIRTSAGLPTAYLDVIKNGQIVLTRWLDVKDGKAVQRLDLPQEVFGTLEVHAYQMLRSGEMIRDSRVVYVQPRQDLKIAVTTDKPVHQPGENGRIHFQVTDAQGKPAVAALGVIIVDEAVYALQEMQPGLEKVYFTLQEELLKPQAQVAYRPSENMADLVRQRVMAAEQQQIAQVLLTGVRPGAPTRWEVAPVLARQRRMERLIPELGDALYDYAVSGRRFLTFSKKTGTWQFRSGLPRKMIGAGFFGEEVEDVEEMKEDDINEVAVKVRVPAGPFGGELRLGQLAQLEKNFTAKRLAQAVNLVRIHELGAAFLRYANANRARFFKGGKWQLPATALADAGKSGGLDDARLTDPWGTPYRLARLTPKQSLLASFQLVSAGPDRRFGTKDDVKCTKLTDAVLRGFRVDYSVQEWWTSGKLRLDVQQFRPAIKGGRKGFGPKARGMGGAKKGAARRRMGPRARPKQDMADDKANDKEDDKANDDMADRGQGRKVRGGKEAGPPIRVRKYFPETLRWDPAVITDSQGRATVALTYADSITTWRLSASASSRGGALGGVSAPLRVFQDFFVDLDLPVHLTQNDEVAFPVAVYNYLKTPQTVKLELQKEPWFELTDAGGYARSLDLKPNEVTSVKFRIKARKIGFQPLLVKARGSKLSDAIRRTIEVLPDGKRIEQVVTDRLAGKVTQTIAIPEHALPEASRLMVKIYPGVVSQVLEGAEGMIRLPGG
jgi:hypothetical protein